ncbi:hypothetical protein [Arthrobacter sp. STN4]|uniref:hypothetical protein n=1 Tax=Arthrobacter sp. STN4 TaxID=2923276 RepID=UPI002119F0DC|nr:hypothetical protein [Arthrobacter sp. STN4]MCQ9164298.1 hypothetical protein [Arthrobacter sp. STN4]
MQAAPRITVEVPVLAVGAGPADYEGLGVLVDGLRRPRGLHMTLLHLGILDDFSRDVSQWTRGISSPGDVQAATVRWLGALPVLAPFSGRSAALTVLGGGSVCGLEVGVPREVRDFQVELVQALHRLLDGLLVDNVDDFILSSRALGYRHPHWTPHVSVGRPKTRDRRPLEIEPLALDFGASRIRNRQFLPEPGPAGTSPAAS